MHDFDAKVLEQLLNAVGAHLEAQDATASILVVGGAALALVPTDQELGTARRWVVEQDAGPEFAQTVDEVVTYVRHHRTGC